MDFSTITLEEMVDRWRGWKRESTPEEDVRAMLDALDEVSLHQNLQRSQRISETMSVLLVSFMDILFTRKQSVSFRRYVMRRTFYHHRAPCHQK